MTNTAETKTLITPEMVEEIRGEFVCHIDFWKKAYVQSETLDGLAMERLGVKQTELENAGLSAQSAQTKEAESIRESLEFLLGVFERGVALGDLYLEDELEFYAVHIRHRQEAAPEYPGIIGGYEAAQEILKAYL